MALASGFLLQITGLQHTLAGVSGFLTGAAVILTPGAAALFHEQVGRAGWAGRPPHTGIAALAGGVSAPSSVAATLTWPAAPDSLSTSPA